MKEAYPKQEKKKKNKLERSILAYSKTSNKISVAELKCAGIEW